MTDIAANGLNRCSWAGSEPIYVDYHDSEWGRPVVSDTRLFEKLCLEGFQAGLSWLTVLKKRERFRQVFHGFEIARVAAITDENVDVLLKDSGIIRHRGKIVSTINNARRALELQKEFGSLAAYFWRFEPKPEHRPDRITREAVIAMPHTEASHALSKDLRKRGFSFVGPTTCYAFMQAMGMVNDHFEDCWCRSEVEELRAALVRPGRG
jgi:DNA-3-methyladenine glycosylase I